MGIAYRCENSIRLSVEVWDGEVTVDSCHCHIAALVADPEWGSTGLVLTDLTGISPASRPSVKQVLEVAAEFSEKLTEKVQNAKWAIVASETFVLAARFGTYLEEEVRRLIVFNDLETACTWLGVDAKAARIVIEELRGDLRLRELIRKPPN